jgi:Tfp pilus assembly protein PilO
VTGRRAPLIVGAIGLVLAILMIMFLVLPKMHQVSAANDSLAAAAAENGTLQSQLNALNDAKDEAPENAAIIQKVSEQLPPTANEPSMLLLLANAASAAGLPLTQFTPGAPTPDPTTGLTTIPVAFAVTGTYFALAQFLFNVETLPRVAKVTSATITSGSESTSAASPSLQMNGSITFYTTDTSAGPGSEPGPTNANGTVTTLPTLPPTTPSSSPGA